MGNSTRLLVWKEPPFKYFKVEMMYKTIGNLNIFFSIYIFDHNAVFCHKVFSYYKISDNLKQYNFLQAIALAYLNWFGWDWVYMQDIDWVCCTRHLVTICQLLTIKKQKSILNTYKLLYLKKLNYELYSVLIQGFRSFFFFVLHLSRKYRWSTAIWNIRVVWNFSEF